jgi:hypothetical protein
MKRPPITRTLPVVMVITRRTTPRKPVRRTWKNTGRSNTARRRGRPSRRPHRIECARRGGRSVLSCMASFLAFALNPNTGRRRRSRLSTAYQAIWALNGPAILGRSTHSALFFGNDVGQRKRFAHSDREIDLADFAPQLGTFWTGRKLLQCLQELILVRFDLPAERRRFGMLPAASHLFAGNEAFMRQSCQSSTSGSPGGRLSVEWNRSFGIHESQSF